MRTARQDAWTPEDDTVLSDIILRHVRTGSTQLNAFREAGQILGRTDSACGFRWNAVVRKQFAAAIEVAKAERRSHKRAQSQEERARAAVEFEDAEEDAHDALSWNEVIRFLKTHQAESQVISSRLRQLERDLHSKTLEVEQAHRENEQLRQEICGMFRELSQVRQDYVALVQIFERARREVALEPSEQLERVE